MKTLYSLCLLACLMAFSGCKSPTLTTTRVAGTTTITVDAAMQAWGEYVRSGRASVQDRVAVRTAYQKYQAAMQVAETAAVNALTAPQGQATYQTALATAAATAAELLALIETFIPPTK